MIPTSNLLEKLKELKRADISELGAAALQARRDYLFGVVSDCTALSCAALDVIGVNFEAAYKLKLEAMIAKDKDLQMIQPDPKTYTRTPE